MMKTVEGRKHYAHLCQKCHRFFSRRSDKSNTTYCTPCAWDLRRKPFAECSVGECGRKAEVEGTCIMHYSRNRRTGRYTNSQSKPVSFDVDSNGCFNCTSHEPGANGYCAITRGRKRDYIHRFVYRECFGDIPEGLVVRHKCDNPRCINPEHLEVGTHQDNQNDKVERKRHKYGEKVWRSKLTEADVIEIKDRLLVMDKEGVSMSAISRDYGVHPNTIYDIYHNRTWGYLNEW